MIIPVEGLPEVTETFNIGKAIAERVQMTDGDIVAVSQKIVSKSEAIASSGLMRPTPDRMPSRWPPGPARIRGWQQHAEREPNPIRVDEQRSPDHRDPSRFHLRKRRHRPVEYGPARTKRSCCRWTRTVRPCDPG